jgi:hypothetical protein
MTDLEKQVLEARIQIVESRSIAADVRSQLALQVATALRDVLAIRSRQFDSEFVKQLGSMPALSVPSKDQLDSWAKLSELLESLERTRKNLEQPIRPESQKGEAL